MAQLVGSDEGGADQRLHGRSHGPGDPLGEDARVEQGAASQANPQLLEAEKRYRARGMDMVSMRRFYGTVIKTLAANRGGSLVSQWVEKEKQSRTGS